MKLKVITVAALLLATTYICPAQTIDSGVGAPSSSVGNNGDLYHRTDVPSVYGPKASGSWPSTFSYIVGQGCTTAYHIDKDCDGYGVGPTTITTDPNPLFGPDADDRDATVNTPASILTKYSSISAFLTHLGYPTSRVFYIDPVKGVDASGCGTVASPCQHFSYSAIGTVLNDGAGGTVMYRASTSAGLQICTGGGCYYPHASSLSSPVVIMAYPGEQVTFTSASAPLNGGGGSYNASTNVIFSGFSLISSNPGSGYGIVGSWVQNITLENSELAGWSMAVQFAAGSQNTTITQNLFHDVSEHAVYPVTGDQSQGAYSSSLFNCSTWTWQANNTSYNPHINFSTTNNVMLYVGSGGYDAIHYNGQICGGLVSGNVLIDGRLCHYLTGRQPERNGLQQRHREQLRIWDYGEHLRLRQQRVRVHLRPSGNFLRLFIYWRLGGVLPKYGERQQDHKQHRLDGRQRTKLPLLQTSVCRRLLRHKYIRHFRRSSGRSLGQKHNCPE